jgi:uncharacterized membrane protein YraQ (UPF0718 family)
VPDLLDKWSEAAITSLGFFWMALWAFVLGYLISSIIQVMVSRHEMRKLMGDDGPKSMTVGTVFGFISSSCSFAALATTRALFQKGANFSPSIAFLLSSTNLVIELGFVIALFLGWQFVVGEYVGGIILILFAWLFILLSNPKKLIQKARDRNQDEGDSDDEDGHAWSRIFDKEIWSAISQKYVMEWQMVWKDVLIGFTIAGVISAFVPTAFFEWMFIGAGNNDPGFWALLQQTLVGPIAAFFTFIGSMGNIPLAAVLFGEGVAFAGVMAFIFSDLVVLPVLRINAQYYGWKMALYILLLLFTCLIATSLLLHYGLQLFDWLPDRSQWTSPAERDHFQLNYQFWLNLLFGLASLWMVVGWKRQQQDHQHHGHHHHHGGGQPVMNSLCVLALIWLTGGLILSLLQ